MMLRNHFTKQFLNFFQISIFQKPIPFCRKICYTVYIIFCVAWAKLLCKKAVHLYSCNHLLLISRIVQSKRNERKQTEKQQQQAVKRKTLDEKLTKLRKEHNKPFERKCLYGFTSRTRLHY